MNTLRHLAIIMDGNGRWATGRNRPRTFGHVTGANVASDIIRYSSQIGIPTLSLFAFSKENSITEIKKSFINEMGVFSKNFEEIIAEKNNLMSFFKKS